MSKRLTLYTPAFHDLWYRKQIMEDPSTMIYNRGYNLSIPGYHPDTGCIDFPPDVWKEWYDRWIGQEPDRFYAYIVRETDGQWLGEVCLHKSPTRDWHDMGLVLEGRYRGMGYSSEALELLLHHAFHHLNVTAIHNDFEETRSAAMHIHLAAGFSEFCRKDGLVELLLTRAQFIHREESHGSLVTLRPCDFSDAEPLKSWLYPQMPLPEIHDMISLWNQGQHEGRYFEMLAILADGQTVGTVSLYAQSDGSISCGPDIFPPFRRHGYAFAALTQALERARRKGFSRATASIRKDNAASLALHSKLGFSCTGERTTRHGHSAYIFQKDLTGLSFRRIRPGEEAEVSALIARTLRTTNIRDYSEEYIENDVRALSPENIRKRSEWTHFYVVCDGEKIIGCGAIGPYWGKTDESSLFTIFVLPEYQGRGVGRKIMETLEQDEYFLRARRIEIPASITACPFYLKMGYRYKNDVTLPDEELLFRLEKQRNV